MLQGYDEEGWRQVSSCFIIPLLLPLYPLHHLVVKLETGDRKRIFVPNANNGLRWWENNFKHESLDQTLIWNMPPCFGPCVLCKLTYVQTWMMFFSSYFFVVDPFQHFLAVLMPFRSGILRGVESRQI